MRELSSSQGDGKLWVTRSELKTWEEISYKCVCCFQQVNSLNKGTEANNSHITIPNLSSVRKWDHRLKQKPDYQVFLAYDFYRIDNPHFYGEGYEFYNGKLLKKSTCI